MGLLDESIPVGQLHSPVKALIYGPAGTRKSSFCKDAPKPIIFDFERSADSLKFLQGTENVTVIRVDRTNPKHTAEYVLLGMVQALSDPKYETIVIDTVDRMHSFFLKRHLEKIEVEGKTLVGGGTFKRTRYLPQQQDHNLITNYLDDFFELAQSSPKNVVYISHEVEQFDPPDSEGNRKFRGIRPGMTPALSKKLRELINVVAFMNMSVDLTKKSIVTMQVAPTGQPIIAKNRLGIETPVISNPTWQSVFINKGKEIK
jgi:phage nucleotide-binding protein